MNLPKSTHDRRNTVLGINFVATGRSVGRHRKGRAGSTLAMKLIDEMRAAMTVETPEPEDDAA